LKLPKHLQDDLKQGTITERQATALLTIYTLPPVVVYELDRANIQHNPAGLVASAKDGMASGELRTAIDNLLNNYTIDLTKNAPWLEIPLDGDGIRAHLCQDCSCHFKRKSARTCADIDCFALKKQAYQIYQLQEASQTFNIPILDGEFGTYFYHSKTLHGPDGVLTTGCEHLRLHIDHQATPDERVAKSYPHIAVVCAQTECPCKATRLQAQRAARQTDEPTASTEQQKDLAAARNHYEQTINNPAQKRIAAQLAAMDERVWNKLAAFVFWRWDERDQDRPMFEEIWDLYAQMIINRSIGAYYPELPPEKLHSRFNKLNTLLTQLGCEPLPAPDPITDLIARFERIKGWLDQINTDTPRKALEGNLANLEKLKTEYNQLTPQQQSNARLADFYTDVFYATIDLEAHLRQLDN